MTTTHRRILGAGIAATAIAAFVASHARHRRGCAQPRATPTCTTVQLLSFNDYHGHLEATDPPLTQDVDPTQTPVGGAEYLATQLTELRGQGRRRATASPSPPATSSAARRSSPASSTTSRRSSRSTRWAWTSAASATTSSTRAPPSCCACRRAAATRSTAATSRDAALRRRRLPVPRRQRRRRRTAAGTLLPGTWVKNVDGVKVGFIGMTLEAHPDPGHPAGVAERRVQGRGRDRQRAGRAAQEAGRQGDRRADARGRLQRRHATTQCDGISGPIVDDRDAARPRDRRDHHRPHPPALHLHDPRPGRQPAPRHQRGVLRPDGHRDHLVINTRSGEVVRGRTTATNHLVTRSRRQGRRPRRPSSPSGTPWPAPLRRTVVGTHAEHITRRLQRQPRHRDADGATSSPTRSSGAPRRRNGGAQIALDEHRRRAGQPATPRRTARARARSPTPRRTTSRRSATCYSRSTSPAPRSRTVLEQQYQPVAGPWLAADARARRLRRVHLRLGRHAAAGLARRPRLDDAQRHPDRPDRHRTASAR